MNIHLVNIYRKIRLYYCNILLNCLKQINFFYRQDMFINLFFNIIQGSVNVFNVHMEVLLQEI